MPRASVRGIHQPRSWITWKGYRMTKKEKQYLKQIVEALQKNKGLKHLDFQLGAHGRIYVAEKDTKGGANEMWSLDWF